MHAAAKMLESAGWPGLVVLLGLVGAVGAALAHARRPTARTLRWAVVGIVLVIVVGVGGLGLGLLGAFGAVSGVDPAHKAERLARGISQAMNCGAFALAAVFLWSPPFVVGELRRARARPGVRAARLAPPGPEPPRG
jgi:hypothetical protein